MITLFKPILQQHAVRIKLSAKSVQNGEMSDIWNVTQNWYKFAGVHDNYHSPSRGY